MCLSSTVAFYFIHIAQTIKLSSKNSSLEKYWPFVISQSCNGSCVNNELYNIHIYQQYNVPKSNHVVSTDISILLTRRSSGSLTGCIKPSLDWKKEKIKIAGVYCNSINKFSKLLLHRKESQEANKHKKYIKLF